MGALLQDARYALRLAAPQPGLRRRRDPDARARDRHGHDDLLDPRRRRAAPAPLPGAGRAHDGVDHPRGEGRDGRDLPVVLAEVREPAQTCAFLRVRGRTLPPRPQPHRRRGAGEARRRDRVGVLLPASRRRRVGGTDVSGRRGRGSGRPSRGGDLGRTLAPPFRRREVHRRQEDRNQPRAHDGRRHRAPALRGARRRRRHLGPDGDGGRLPVSRHPQGGRQPLAQRRRPPQTRASLPARPRPK